jgi:predicted amidophosphoribosyltransferase
VTLPTPLSAVLDALLPSSCLACGRPALQDQFCAACTESVDGAPPGAVACWTFGGAVADAIRACKFRPEASLADALGRCWATRLASGSCPALPPVDGVAFVPAHWRRRLARGFDLPAVLAQQVARAAGAPVVDALVPLRLDAPLSFGADKALRAVAVAGRFRLRRAVKDRRLLLIDDVRTTGATLGEAARVLREAGAEVHEAALAVVP